LLYVLERVRSEKQIIARNAGAGYNLAVHKIVGYFWNGRSLWADLPSNEKRPGIVDTLDRSQESNEEIGDNKKTVFESKYGIRFSGIWKLEKWKNFGTGTIISSRGEV